jgi:hypothetical protein
MTPIHHTDSGAVFVGSVDEGEDLAAAAAVALRCDSFARDEDDECYVDGDDPTCFDCRARRWVRGGFTCTRGLLPA